MRPTRVDQRTYPLYGRARVRSHHEVNITNRPRRTRSGFDFNTGDRSTVVYENVVEIRAQWQTTIRDEYAVQRDTSFVIEERLFTINYVESG